VKDSKQPEMQVPQNSTEFSDFILMAANRCDLPPEEFFLGAIGALAAAAISYTKGQESALAIFKVFLEHGTLLINEFYQGPSESAVPQ
jgi:hypothetical protein